MAEIFSVGNAAFSLAALEIQVQGQSENRFFLKITLPYEQLARITE